MKDKKMNKNKKISISVIVLLLAVLLVYAGYNAIIFFTQEQILSSTPDTTDWVLTNDDYTVIPVITEDNVTFYVENKDRDIVYESENGWREWDFKSINIDGNNVITAVSGDTGTFVYKEDGKGSFYLDELISDS